MTRKRYAHGLVVDLVNEGFKISVEPNERGNIIAKVIIPDTGYEVVESSARETVEDAVIEAFLDTPDLETAREIEADDIPF